MSVGVLACREMAFFSKGRDSKSRVCCFCLLKFERISQLSDPVIVHHIVLKTNRGLGWPP